MNVEEDYLDVLQNIESIASEAGRADPKLTDYDVEKIYNTLVIRYSTELTGKHAVAISANAVTQVLFNAVLEMCEWRLGRITSESLPAVEPIDLDAMLARLKRLRKSVQRWTKDGGRRGYLTFISDFV